MLAVHVLVEGRLAAEALVALVDFARIWTLVAVYLTVPSKTRGVGESLAAYSAFVRLLTGVGSDVDSQGAGLDERLAAVVVMAFVVSGASVSVMVPNQI